MFAENDVVKDAANTEDITDWMGFCRHVLDVDDFWRDISWCSASHEKIVWIVGYSCQTKVDDYWFFTKNDIVRFKVTMNDIFPGHFYEATEDTFHYELSLGFCVFKKIVETAADRTTLNIFQGKVDWVLGFVDAFYFHEIGMVEHAGDFNFVEEGLSTVLLWECGLFSKGLDSHFFMIFELDAQVDSGKITFTESFFCFKKLVEIELIHEFA